MVNEVFREAYERLNEEQKKAVDTIEGPVMVIAGPGTGKTQILTLRIANILAKTDTQPENILALTFTESGVKAMRERLVAYIGARAYRVAIHTFHEFAGKLIRSYPEAYGRPMGGKPLGELEKVTHIESILESSRVKLLRPSGNPEYYVKPLLGILSTMKREYITPDHLAEIILDQERVLEGTPKLHEKGAHKGKVRGEYLEREKKLGKNRELLHVYRAYESVLALNRQFDFDDMIFETVRMLEGNEDVLRSLQEEYQYILADEHQDVNGSQNRILELLASFHERPNIFVVGDEKQSIYRFQGASLENFLYFEEKFSHTTTIALTRNYRSKQEILDLAHTLIYDPESPAADLRVPLTAHGGVGAVIEMRTFSHESVEHDAIVTMVQSLIERDVPLNEIALIVRTNAEVQALASHLRTFGVPARASADGDILYHPITTHVRILMRAVLRPDDEEALFELLSGGCGGIGAADFVRIARLRSYDRPLAAVMRDPELLERSAVTDLQAVARATAFIDAARERVRVEPPHRVLEFILHESGFFSRALHAHPADAARIIRRLYDEVEEMVESGSAITLSDVEKMFETQIAHGIELNAPYIEGGTHAVEVMTAHKAKGLEFLHVFIPHLTDNRWGGNARAESFDVPASRRLTGQDFSREDDERKLLYVALTRAKVGLYLSSAMTNTEGRAFLPTRLLEGAVSEHVPVVDTTPFESTFDPGASLRPTPRVPLLDPEALREILRERGLSVSSLNNYLRDPWDYFFRNALRIPELQSESALFGTVLHSVLEQSLRYRREHGELPDMTTLKSYLDRALGALPITAHEYTRYHERGFEALTQYLTHVSPSLSHETKEEYSLDGLLETGDPEFPTIRITGKLDRLDFDTEGRLLRVVDYKTGKPKTRGQIEGTTKDSHGDYKRQLTFYALLLSLQEDTRLHTREGLLSFIEPDSRGQVHEEAYTITDAEIEELRKEIVRVVHEITHGAFLNAPCDPEMSSYCHLIEAMRGSES